MEAKAEKRAEEATKRAEKQEEQNKQISDSSEYLWSKDRKHLDKREQYSQWYRITYEEMENRFLTDGRWWYLVGNTTTESVQQPTQPKQMQPHTQCESMGSIPRDTLENMEV